MLLLAAAILPDARASGRSSAALQPRTEIQLSLCTAPHQLERTLDLHRHGASVQTWLFEDASLTLFQSGLRIRLRMARGSSELTLKVADQDCAHLPSGLVPPAQGKCEYDMHGTTIAGAVSLSSSLGPDAARSLLAGRQQLSEALSTAQIRYLREVAHAWPLPADLRALGPQRVTNWRADGRPFEVAVSKIPTGETYVEISRKVAPEDAQRLRAALVDELTRAGVSICADQSAQAVNKLRAMQR
jgi:hypothetical protein